MRMTAESGETRCAWRSTSMPSMLGILMSVTITSYRTPSILFFAACPDCTVSTRWPSRRKAISSISQIERSSSQTRMLAMRPPSGGYDKQPGIGSGSGTRHTLRAWSRALRVQASQPQDESGSMPRLGACPDFALVRLYDLIDNCQPQSGSTFEIRLERFENLFYLLRSHARSGIGKTDLPVVTMAFDGNSDDSPAVHSTNRVFAKIPEHLFDLVAIGNDHCVGDSKPAFDPDSGFFRRHAVIHKGESVFDELHQVNLVEAVSLGAGVREEIRDDAVQS